MEEIFMFLVGRNGGHEFALNCMKNVFLEMTNQVEKLKKVSREARRETCNKKKQNHENYKF